MPATVIGDEALAAKFMQAAQVLTSTETFWLDDVGEMLKLSIQQNIGMQGLATSGKVDSPAHPHLIDTVRVFGLTKHGVNVGTGKGHPAVWPLEFGSTAHAITSWDKGAGASMLSFYWEKRGDWFFGTQVWHPGNRAYRFVHNGTLSAVLPISRYFVSKVAAIFGGL